MESPHDSQPPRGHKGPRTSGDRRPRRSRAHGQPATSVAASQGSVPKLDSDDNDIPYNGGGPKVTAELQRRQQHRTHRFVMEGQELGDRDRKERLKDVKKAVRRVDYVLPQANNGEAAVAQEYETDSVPVDSR